MNTFQLQPGGYKGSTDIPNCFIEKFMPKAAGEFVKIYIYILKCVEENQSELSISRIADVFNDTEKDIIRALKYWDRKGLLTLSFEGDTLVSLKVNHLPDEENTKRRIIKDEEGKKAPVKAREYTKEELDAFSEKEDIPLLLYSITKYLGRPLTNADLNRVIFFCEDLGFSADLVEYLFEYCAGKGHKDIRYIEKTGIGWKNDGINSVKAAREKAAVYSNECYRVLKAFGLTGRNPSKDEADYVNRWIFSYGFDITLILEACSRTMRKIHQPSFEYADTILKNWKEAGINDMDAVKAADEAHEKKAAAKKSGKTSQKSKNTFNNFDQRDYNWDELEAELFNLK